MNLYSELYGRHSRVSRTTHHDGAVLVGFCGDLFPHDLTTGDVQYLKTFYMMPPDCKHEIFCRWPEAIEPAYPVAKKNFRNGFLLLSV